MNRNEDYDEITQQGSGDYDTSQTGGLGRQQGLQGDDTSGGRSKQSQFPGGSDDTYGQQGDDASFGDSWNKSKPQGQSGDSGRGR